MKLHPQVCENCGSSFEDEDDFYDLCPVCVGPYEQALHDAQLEDRSILRVPFPE
jgi:predicted amidophosphoribosyltransferase